MISLFTTIHLSPIITSVKQNVHVRLLFANIRYSLTTAISIAKNTSIAQHNQQIDYIAVILTAFPWEQNIDFPAELRPKNAVILFLILIF